MDYRQNISKIVDAAKKYASHEVIIGGTPIKESKVDPMPWKPTHSLRSKDLEKYREQRVEMCNDRKLDLIEIRPYIDEEDWKENKLRDGRHPNMAGHKTIYRIVKDGLKDREMIPEDA
jgi:lysophospholipase L1-like esterase